MDGFIKIIESFGLTGVLTIAGALILFGFFIDKVYRWILGYFKGYYNKKTEEEDIKESIKELSDQNKQQNETMVEICRKLDLLTNATQKSMKYSIVRACKEYVLRKSITTHELQLLEEMYAPYEDINGNGYAHTMMEKARSLPVIDNYDE